MYFHEKISTSLIRGYSEDKDGYDNKIPYDLIFTIHNLGKGKVFIEGLRGSMDSDTFDEMRKFLISKGYTTAVYERNDKWITLNLLKQ